MKHQWLVYTIVAFLAIGTGLAIAALSNNAPTSVAGVTPATAETSTSIATTSTTEAPPDTTAAPTTTAPTTTVPADTTTTTTTVPLFGRDQVVAYTANGAGIDGAAGRVAVRLEEIGYVDVSALGGTDIVEFTVVYYAEGLEAYGARMASDLDLQPEFIAPLAEAPAVPDLQLNVQLLAYVGLDRS